MPVATKKKLCAGSHSYDPAGKSDDAFVFFIENTSVTFAKKNERNDDDNGKAQKNKKKHYVLRNEVKLYDRNKKKMFLPCVLFRCRFDSLSFFFSFIQITVVDAKKSANKIYVILLLATAASSRYLVVNVIIVDGAKIFHALVFFLHFLKRSDFVLILYTSLPRGKMKHR